MKRRYLARKEEGYCVVCGGPKEDPLRNCCEACRKKQAARDAKRLLEKTMSQRCNACGASIAEQVARWKMNGGKHPTLCENCLRMQAEQRAFKSAKTK